MKPDQTSGTTNGIPPLEPRELSADEERVLNHPLFRRNPPTIDPRDQRLDELAMEIHRLRGALDKIARRYPCSEPEDMARVAKEALQ